MATKAEILDALRENDVFGVSRLYSGHAYVEGPPTVPLSFVSRRVSTIRSPPGQLVHAKRQLPWSNLVPWRRNRLSCRSGAT